MLFPIFYKHVKGTGKGWVKSYLKKVKKIAF